MASQDALGFVEVLGMAAAIEVSDVMVKTAWVKVKTVANADAGLLSVICEGELAACKASVDAGSAAAQNMGAFLRSNLIPRPAEGVDVLAFEMAPSVAKAPAPPEPPAAKATKPKPSGKGKK